MKKLNYIDFTEDGYYDIQAPLDYFWQGLIWQGWVTKETKDWFNLVKYLGKENIK